MLFSRATMPLTSAGLGERAAAHFLERRDWQQRLLSRPLRPQVPEHRRGRRTVYRPLSSMPLNATFRIVWLFRLTNAGGTLRREAAAMTEPNPVDANRKVAILGVAEVG